jgi:hypothetical protein
MFEVAALVFDTAGLIGAGSLILAYVLLPWYRSFPADIILLIGICDLLMVTITVCT